MSWLSVFRATDPFDDWSRGDDRIVSTQAPRADELGQLPPAGPLSLESVSLGPGRPVVAQYVQGGSPTEALWVTEAPVPDLASAWWALAEQFPSTGLWPLVLKSLYDGSGRPWDSGEFMPVDEAAIDALDPLQVLETGWHDCVVPIENPWPPGTGPLAPFGSEFPGLAPRQRSSALPVAVTAGGSARVGQVSCRRPADAVGRVGWLGAINVTGAAEVSAVLRSWEDRFGAVLVGLDFGTMTLLVTRPPTSEDDALRVAAEVAALCPDAFWQPEALCPSEPREATIRSMSRHLVRQHVWRLWFD